jgi:hypothetical protein
VHVFGGGRQEVYLEKARLHNQVNGELRRLIDNDIWYYYRRERMKAIFHITFTTLFFGTVQAPLLATILQDISASKLVSTIQVLGGATLTRPDSHDPKDPAASHQRLPQFSHHWYRLQFQARQSR